MKRYEQFPVKYMVMASIVVLFLLASATIWLNQRIDETVMNNFKDSTETQIEIIDKSINQFLQGIRNDVEMIASFPSIRGVQDGLTKYTDLEKRTLMKPTLATEEEQHLYEIIKLYGESPKGTNLVKLGSE